MAGIYIHIPFCRKACHYCNFHFSTTRGTEGRMVEAINKEAVLNKDYVQEKIETIYLGGGTPSLLQVAELDSILQNCKELFVVDPQAEITLESNPDDIHAEALAGWKSIGINRLSIGVQSFFEEDLQWMNRAHNRQQALAAIALAQAGGFHNITIDLIYGTPGLTNEKWERNIETALALNVPHLSCYALTVEPKTALAKMIDMGRAANTDADQQAQQFLILTERLSAAGFEHYEISNFARPGFRSRHNSSYWQGKPYIGLGPSAHSFNGQSRQWNIANNSLYLTSIGQNKLPFEIEMLTTVQQLNEYIMTSLRTIEGISLAHIREVFGSSPATELTEVAQKYIDHGQLTLSSDHIVLTPGGKFLADGIAADLFFED